MNAALERPWLILAAVFCSAAIYKLLINHLRLLRTKRFLRLHEEYVFDQLEGRGNWEFIEGKLEIIRLFQRTGMEEPRVPHMEPVAPGYAATANIQVWQNMHLISHQDVLQATIMSFHQAIGYYQARRNEALNPLYWIELVLGLPREVLGYIGVSSDSVVVKLVQILYWLVGIAGAVIAIREQLSN